MTPFANSSETFSRLDFQILRDGGFILYLKEEALRPDLEWLRSHDYTRFEMDCNGWKGLEPMHRNLREVFGFPEYYGNNLNALADCLSELELSVAGTYILFRHFGSLEKKLAHSLLDILAHSVRGHLLFGRFLIVLVQVEDANYQLPGFGAISLKWNNSEWLTASRTLNR
ncbi:MAG: barstar family protein [Chitinophagaceae bacterium]